MIPYTYTIHQSGVDTARKKLHMLCIAEILDVKHSFVIADGNAMSVEFDYPGPRLHITVNGISQSILAAHLVGT